jgi:hypothetical protein
MCTNVISGQKLGSYVKPKISNMTNTDSKAVTFHENNNSLPIENKSIDNGELGRTGKKHFLKCFEAPKHVFQRIYYIFSRIIAR